VTTALLLACAAAVSPPAPEGRTQTGGRARRAPGAAAIPVGVGLVTLVAFLTDRAGLVIAASMAAATAVFLIQDRRASRAEARAREACAVFLGHVATGVQAGSSLPEALARAARQLPAGTPAQVVRDVSLMAHHARSATIAAVETPALQRVAVLWSVSAARGVPVSKLIGAARDELDHAARHRAATHAALAGPKTTAAVLAALPLAGMGMGAAMGARPIAFLTGGGLGGVLLIAGTCLVCGGVLSAHAIIRGAAS